MRSEAFACQTSLCVAGMASASPRILASALRLFTVEFVSFGFGLHESVAGVCVRVILGAGRIRLGLETTAGALGFACDVCLVIRALTYCSK